MRALALSALLPLSGAPRLAPAPAVAPAAASASLAFAAPAAAPSLAAAPAPAPLAAPTAPAPALAAAPVAASAPEDGPRSPESGSVEAGAPFDGGAGQAGARARLLALRAAALPAHAWPFTALARRLSHGEALAGLTPRGAVAAARAIRGEHGTGAVVGRLSWELHDRWSVRGAVRSYERLIAELGRAKAADPSLDASVSLDPEALGAQLDGLTDAERLAVTRANVLRLARAAKAAGVPLEFDAGAGAVLALQVEVARAAVLATGVPVRLAVAARYAESEDILRDWSALARATGLRLGVRLVKGSFIEDRPGAVNERGPLLARYKRLITRALEAAPSLDVAVATQNEEVWEHARAESRRLGAAYSVHAIRGVNAPLQERMRAEGVLAREYVSYGLDTPVMALMELWTNARARRALERRGASGVD